jgi:fructose-bisphosphate aldolase class I
MFRLIHQMRARIMTAPAFSGEKILGAILFEATMDGLVDGKPTAEFLWNDRGIVPFLKVDKGLEAASGGVRLMKPMPALQPLLQRALAMGIFGTKMRSVIDADTQAGIAAIVQQQFEIGAQIAEAGLMPILEPEVTIRIPDKVAAEARLRNEIQTRLDALPADRLVMLKLTIPDVPDFYRSLIEHPRVARVVALSGGYTRDEASALLAKNPGLIASFSRALVDELRAQASDAQFDRDLQRAVDQIYAAST